MRAGRLWGPLDCVGWIVIPDRRPQGALSADGIFTAIRRASEDLIAGNTPVSIGLDVVDLVEFGHNLEASGSDWSTRVFTRGEVEYSQNSVERLGARFAAKEAVAKALGYGFRELGPLDIEIVTPPEGNPTVVLHGEGIRVAREAGITDVFVSISREGDCAAAVAIGIQTKSTAGNGRSPR